MRPWRLSLGQMLLIGTIDRFGSASAADLARALHLTPQAMTTLLRPLEERGIITRAVDPANRRRLALSLSSHGLAMLADVCIAAERVDDQLTSALSEVELEQFRTLLAKIAQRPQGEPVRKEITHPVKDAQPAGKPRRGTAPAR